MTMFHADALRRTYPPVSEEVGKVLGYPYPDTQQDQRIATLERENHGMRTELARQAALVKALERQVENLAHHFVARNPQSGWPAPPPRSHAENCRDSVR